MNPLFLAAVRLASSRPAGDPLRTNLLRLLTADVPAERGREEEPETKKKKGPPPMWKEFLDAKYEGGKKKVQNTDPDTSDRYKQVSMTTRFKKDKSYQKSVYKEYQEWMKKQKGEKKPDSSESKPKEPEKPKAEEKKEEPKKEKKPPTLKDVGEFLSDMVDDDQGALSTVAKALASGKSVASTDLKQAIAWVNDLEAISDDDVVEDLREMRGVLMNQLAKRKKEEEAEEKKEEPKAEKPAWLPDSTKAWNEYGEQWNPSRETWSEPEKYGVREYTSSGYHELNSDLRKGNTLSSYYQKIADGLDSIFKDPKKGRVVKEVMVARGAGQSHPLTKLLNNDALEVGMEFADKGYVSTSIKPWGAHSWGTGVQMSIHVPKGAKGIYVGPPPHGYSSVSSEYELLLDRGVKMRVTGFNKSTRTVELEVVV